MKILCQDPIGGRPPKQEIVQLKNELTKFYKTHYLPLCPDNKIESLDYRHLNTVLDYETNSIFTDYQNHIKEHFLDFFNRYLNVITDSAEMIKKIKENKLLDKDEQKEQIKKHRKELRDLKDDILGLNSTYKSSDKYKKLIQTQKNFLFSKDKYEKDSILYDLQCHPLDYLKSLIKMSIEIEKRGEKTFNVFPLRTTLTPKHIIIDTTTVVHLLFDQINNKKIGTKDSYLSGGNLVKKKDKIWKFFFRTEKQKIFGTKNKQYRFNHQISTNGLSCSILLIRSDLYKEGQRNKVKTVKKPKGFRMEAYADEIGEVEKNIALEKSQVTIDPGIIELLYATNGQTEIVNGKHKTTQWRYTNDQRRQETRSKYYQKLIEKDKNKTKINGTSVKNWETKLSSTNSKSCRWNSLIGYLSIKLKVSSLLLEYYSKDLYRQIKWWGKINRQRSESRMINSFKKIFGGPEEVVIGFGDWDQKGHLKYCEPTKGKGFRTVFRRAGYTVYLVDEYRTSARDFITLEETETFRKRKHPRPYRTKNTDNKHNLRVAHGLLRSKTVPSNKSGAKSTLWNRNLNGSLNINRIFKCNLENREPPQVFKRGT